jgi:hypothetical protein
VEEQIQRKGSSRLVNLSALGERCRECCRLGRRGDSEMCSLAEPARGVVLPAGVDVGGRENYEQECADCQAGRQQGSGVTPSARSQISLSQQASPHGALDATYDRAVSTPA